MTVLTTWRGIPRTHCQSQRAHHARGLQYSSLRQLGMTISMVYDALMNENPPPRYLHWTSPVNDDRSSWQQSNGWTQRLWSAVRPLECSNIHLTFLLSCRPAKHSIIPELWYKHDNLWSPEDRSPIVDYHLCPKTTRDHKERGNQSYIWTEHGEGACGRDNPHTGRQSQPGRRGRRRGHKENV